MIHVVGSFRGVCVMLLTVLAAAAVLAVASGTVTESATSRATVRFIRVPG